MTSRYSRVSNGGPKPKTPFKKHQVFEVATSLTESKYIANDLANAKRYAYRAKVQVVGDPNVKPYEPIYLDGLADGMSGYWTVLSVKHIFGGAPAKYLMEVEVGTDVLGDVNPNAWKAVPQRDITGELAGQSLRATTSTLTDYSFSVNNSDLTPDFGVTIPSSSVSKKQISVSENIVPTDPYSVTPPDFRTVKRTVTWRAE